MKNDEQLKSLIRDNDEQFNSLFENEKNGIHP